MIEHRHCQGFSGRKTLMMYLKFPDNSVRWYTGKNLPIQHHANVVAESEFRSKRYLENTE